MFQRFLHAEKNGFGGEEPLLHAHRLREGIQSLTCRQRHQAQQRAPIHRLTARQMSGPAVHEPQFIRGNNHEPRFIQPAPAGAAEHLQDFVRTQRLLHIIPPVRGRRQRHAAQGKIDARRQSHRRHDHPQLPRLGQRLNHPRPHPITQAAVMIHHARRQHLRQMLPRQRFLLGGERERIGIGQIARDLRRHRLRPLPPGRKHQERTQILRQRLGHQARPVTLDLTGQGIAQTVRRHLLQWHRPHIRPDQLRRPPQSPQPFHDILRIRHTAAEQEQLRIGGSQRQREFIIQPPVRVADHLVLVHHQQGRAVTPHQAVLLRFQRGHEDGSGKIFRQVAGGDTHVPAARAPFGQLVISQRAGGHGIDGLAAIFPAVGP